MTQRTFKARRPLSAAQQLADLKGSASGLGTGNVGRLHWSFEARPTPISRTYSVNLTYRLGSRPRVVVVKPDLVDIAGGRALPHVYGQRPPSLCLYLPWTGEWAPHKLLSKTIVPWTHLWLFYFEEWVRTGEWRGGGVHPHRERTAA